jgi:hypothetical protein
MVIELIDLRVRKMDPDRTHIQSVLRRRIRSKYDWIPNTTVTSTLPFLGNY